MLASVERRLRQLLRAVSSPGESRRDVWLTTVIALTLTVGVVVVIFAALGVNPGSGLRSVIDGSLGNRFAFGQTVSITTLLILTGLAAAIPFSARLWNIGGEGQLYFGAFAAAAIALTMPVDTPPWLFVGLSVIAGVVGGIFWGLIPGILKAAADANEMIVSLMSVFIAILVANYAITDLWPEGFKPATEDIPPGGRLPRIWEGTLVDAGALLAVFAVVVGWVIMSRMRLGFEIRAIGLNSQTARMNGISPQRGAVGAFGLGGGFAGLAGAIAVLGLNGALVDNFSRNFGFIGIAVALVARLNPVWIIPSALFFSILRVGTNSLPAKTGLDPSMGEILVATFVILLLASRVIRLRYAEAAT